jgi:hypothetical protein
MEGFRFRSIVGLAIVLANAPACHDETPRRRSPSVPAPHGTDDRTEPTTASREMPPGPVAPSVVPSSDGSEVEPPPVPYVHFDVNHVLSTGQSNSVANDAVQILTDTQPFANLMFDVGVMTATSCDGDGCTTYQKPSALLPLVEGDSFWYPVETMSSGLANLVAKLGSEKHHALLVSLHGRSGNSYQCLRKGSCDWWPGRNYIEPFAEGMMQVADAKALATAAGKSYAVRAVTAIHGEHDHYAYASGDSAFPMIGTDGVSVIASYADGLLEWQRDYEAGAKAITGQTVPVPLFISQYSHWNNVPTTKIAYMQLDAHVRSNGKVIMVGPTYALPYTDACLHFTSDGERHLGEQFAKAYARVILDGRKWEPLRPMRVSLERNVVTVKFHVPVPPLVIDTTRVDDPGQYGFEWYDGSAIPPAITNVALVSADTVAITLASVPTGPDKRIRYAYTFHGCAGPRTLARGNIRDSDSTPSNYGYDLFNWAVHFDEPIAP